MQYVRGFKDLNGDGYPDMPEKYRGKLGRIVREPSLNPVSLLKRGNYLTWSVFAALLAAAAAAAAAVTLIVRKRRKR
jgi:hypothetical protein